jgi:hypothetical protein
MLKDGLCVLKQLSLYLQNNDHNVMSAMDHIDDAKEKLLALKIDCGKTLKKFWDSYDKDESFQGVPILKNANDDESFETFRGQFFQALHDNYCQRFPCTDVLGAARVLNRGQKIHWRELCMVNKMWLFCAKSFILTLYCRLKLFLNTRCRNATAVWMLI